MSPKNSFDVTFKVLSVRVREFLNGRRKTVPSQPPSKGEITVLWSTVTVTAKSKFKSCYHLNVLNISLAINNTVVHKYNV